MITISESEDFIHYGSVSPGGNMKVSITVLGELSALHSDGCCSLTSSTVVNHGCDDGSDDQPV